ncbi:hypothetical protein XELAEV_18018713mg [Xenopus laevis]|uniref:G-protein coupled receptors family 1 profile domain-containing protein n=1 Tax=Xenopus laevis TaxID=8355 RepID=A0A974DE07_XENLA|nr:hypothetical protein XELAEV_18018713mg [Xenopus laevis]
MDMCLFSTLLTYYVIPFVQCFIQLCLFMTTATTEVFLLTSMAYDRWVFGFINALVVTTFASKLCFGASRVIYQLFCDIKSLFSISCSEMKDLQPLIYLEILFVGFCPFLLSLISYAKIIFNILKVQSTQGRRKTFSTCTAHLTVLLLFYGTSICVYMRPLSENSENHEQVFSVLYVAVTPILNPLIYSLRNQDVKKALNKIFGVEGKLSSFYH